MTVMSERDARRKGCPSLAGDPGSGNCRGSACMAWETDRDGTPEAAARIYQEDIDVLELSARANRGLREIAVTTVKDLVSLDERRIKRIPNIGKLTLRDITRALALHGLELGPAVETLHIGRCRRI